jgi:magnesium transporter
MGNYTLITVSLENIKQDQGEVVYSFDSLSQLLEEVRQKSKSHQKFYWVSLVDPTQDDLSLLDQTYELHPVIREDFEKHNPIPKFVSYRDYSYVLAHRVFYRFEEQNCENRCVSLIFNQKLIITLHQHHLKRTFDLVRERLLTEKELLGRLGVEYILFQILMSLVEDYRPIVSSWEAELEELEEMIFKGSLEPVTEKILKFKKLVLVMKRYLIPQRAIYQQIFEHCCLGQSEQHSVIFLKNVVDEMNSTLDDFESLGNQASSVFEVYAANLSIELNKSSHSLNQVMQRLSIMTAIFLPLSFIVGVYGMNIEGIPELKWSGFYFLLWGVMISIVCILLFVFKKLKWY